MAIKRLRIAFDIDTVTLAAALAQHNSGMHIQLLGNAVEGPVPDDDEYDASAKALPLPKRGALQNAVLQYMKTRGSKTINSINIAEHFNVRTEVITNALTRLRKLRLVQHVGYAQYRL